MASAKKPSKATDMIVGIDFGTTKICAVIGQLTGKGLEVVGIGKEPSLGNHSPADTHF